MTVAVTSAAVGVFPRLFFAIKGPDNARTIYTEVSKERVATVEHQNPF
jgi:hypothetical protein